MTKLDVNTGRWRLVSLATSSALLLIAMGCKAPTIDLTVSLTARTNQGEPVADGAVSLAGRWLGTTDSRGRLVATAPVEPGTKVRIEVAKDSDLYYFAPFHQDLVIEPLPPGPMVFGLRLPWHTAEEPPARHAEVEAVLYFVPKPTGEEVAAPTGESPLLAQQKAPAPDPSAPPLEGPARPAVPDDEVEDQGGAPAQRDQERGATPGGDGEAPLVPEPGPSQVRAEPSPPLPSLSPPVAPVPTDTLVTLYITGAGGPLADADVRLGTELARDLRSGCRSNQRGRCVIHLPGRTDGLLTVLIHRAGFVTKTATLPPGGKDSARIDLEPGPSLDVFAKVSSYGRSQGLKGVDVYVGGKRLGVTDRFGHFSYGLHAKPDDLIRIKLKASGYGPESFDTDFVAGSGGLSLTKVFTPLSPRPVKMAVLDPLPAGPVAEGLLSRLSGSGGDRDGEAGSLGLDQTIRRALRATLFAKPPFQEYSVALLERAARHEGGSALAVKAPQQGELAATADADILLRPTIIGGSPTMLELVAQAVDGRVLTAVMMPVLADGPVWDARGMERTIKELAERLRRTFPREGAVVASDGAVVKVNLGRRHQTDMVPGDRLTVIGTQVGPDGQSQEPAAIGQVVVTRVDDSSSSARLERREERALVAAGDLVVLRRGTAAASAPRRLVKVRQATDGGTGGDAPVEGATLYLNGTFLGATDQAGEAEVLADQGELSVVSPGHEVKVAKLTAPADAPVVLGLRRAYAFLRVDSNPIGAEVLLDGKSLGKTPLATTVTATKAMAKLSLQPPMGLKPVELVVALDQSAVSLTGPAKVTFERDDLGRGRSLVRAGKPEDAVRVLEAVPRDHSDFFAAQKAAGDILLTILGEPARAAAAFARVTADGAGRGAPDRDLVQARIDEGVALTLTGERLAQSGKTGAEDAVAHWLKAIDVLSAARNALPREAWLEQEAALARLDFHLALARHDIAQETQDARLAAESTKAWRAFLDTHAGNEKEAGPASSVERRQLADQARTYIQKSQVLATRGKGVVRQ